MIITKRIDEQWNEGYRKTLRQPVLIVISYELWAELRKNCGPVFTFEDQGCRRREFRGIRVVRTDEEDFVKVVFDVPELL